MDAAQRTVEGVSFPGPEGSLEGLWSDPGGGRTPAVICHPHPAHGGTMHSKVVHTVYKVLHEAGHPTIRFNFRGVGRSAGSYSGWDGEVEDVRTGTGPLWLAGFSFGSWVGSMWALRDGQVERFIGLGIPASTNIDGRTFDFLDRPPAPMLIVQGTRDQYGSREAILALAERLRAKGQVEVRFVEGADHFFTGHLTQLAVQLRDGLGLEGA
jgi:uncharacterized protein